MKISLSTYSFFLAVFLLIGCNRSDKPQAWESNHARPMQETIAADMQETQPPATQLPAGHPPVDNEPTGESNSQLPKGHPPVSPATDGVVKLGGKAGEVDFEDMHWSAPKSWVSKDTSGGMVKVIAEFKLPRTEGDASDARLTVTMVNGTDELIDLNIKRWRNQFGGKPENELKEQFDVAGVKTNLVDLAGTFKESAAPMMPNAPTIERTGYRMLGVLMLRKDALIVIKAIGPAKTMAARADEVKAFVRSLKIDK